MKIWENTCLELLKKSLSGTNQQEFNEIDWKQDISNNNEKLAQHLSAFANIHGGGFMVFGIENDGSVLGIDRIKNDTIINKLANIARANVEPQVTLDHTTIQFQGKDILMVHILESHYKPVHLKSGTIEDSYTRVVATTRKLSRQDIQKILAVSQGMSFETRLYPTIYQADDIIAKLDYVTYFDLTKTKQPTSQLEVLTILETELLIKKLPQGTYQMTNLGIILLAKDLSEFKEIKRKAPRVIAYEGNNRVGAIKKQNEGNLGYATGFTRLIDYVNTLLPSNEVIQEALRKEVRMYPEMAIRELIANALIHQDFDVSGAGVMVEIFDDRIEITNPGRPFVEINRLMDLPPRSRNEKLADIMRRMHVCEELGSGIDKVVAQCEVYQLPAPLFQIRDNNMVASLFSQRILTKMDREDKIRACYLHACLKHVSGEIMTNESVRKRFKIPDSNYPTASKIIGETLEVGLIKLKDPENKSKKLSQYIPFWA